jgi:hypothetical protein
LKSAEHTRKHDAQASCVLISKVLIERNTFFLSFFPAEN